MGDGLLSTYGSDVAADVVQRVHLVVLPCSVGDRIGEDAACQDKCAKRSSVVDSVSLGVVKDNPSVSDFC